MLNLVIGDMVQTGVYVCGVWLPSNEGKIVSQSADGSVSQIDITSHHGGSPWVYYEATKDLRKL